MSGNLCILLILFGTDAAVLLLSSTVETSAAFSKSIATATAGTDPVTSESSVTESTSTGLSSTTEATTSEGVTEEPGSGLNPAEAAGVAVGTIAGVAALGGGIFAGLKFSGKLG